MAIKLSYLILSYLILSYIELFSTCLQLHKELHCFPVILIKRYWHTCFLCSCANYLVYYNNIFWNSRHFCKNVKHLLKIAILPHIIFSAVPCSSDDFCLSRPNDLVCYPIYGYHSAHHSQSKSYICNIRLEGMHEVICCCYPYFYHVLSYK